MASRKRRRSQVSFSQEELSPLHDGHAHYLADGQETPFPTEAANGEKDSIELDVWNAFREEFHEGMCFAHMTSFDNTKLFGHP